MSRYYSGASIIDWLRKSVFKIDKPTSLPWGQWEVWEDETKKKFPIGYFITETLPDWIEWIPEHTVDYIHEVRYYVRNRFDMTHALTSNLERGKWHEFEERLLHSVFDSFVDFVEIESANHLIHCDGKESYKKYNVPWHQRFSLTSWYRWRCPQAGVDHLKWEMSLDKEEVDPNNPSWIASANQNQADLAREKMALYTWWKEIRANRKDPWAETGLRAFWDKMDAKYGKQRGADWLGLGGKSLLTPSERTQYHALNKAVHELEEARHNEDTEMLTRLIKIRRSLWT